MFILVFFIIMVHNLFGFSFFEKYFWICIIKRIFMNWVIIFICAVSFYLHFYMFIARVVVSQYILNDLTAYLWILSWLNLFIFGLITKNLRHITGQLDDTEAPDFLGYDTFQAFIQVHYVCGRLSLLARRDRCLRRCVSLGIHVDERFNGSRPLNMRRFNPLVDHYLSLN